MEVKVLGTGCANCQNTYMLIEKAAELAQANIQLIKVDNIEAIASYGVVSTPAVVVDGVVVHAGGVPTFDTVLSWLKTTNAGCCAGNAVTASGSCCESSAKQATIAQTADHCSTGSCRTDVGAKNGMGVGALINLMAGSMILLGFVLAHLSGTVDMLTMSWLWLPVFVAFNLIQFSFTGFCPAKRIFEKMGVKKSCC